MLHLTFVNKFATNFIVEFAKVTDCVDCGVCSKKKIVVAQPFETLKIVDEKEREQYLSDYVFD